MPYIRIAFDFVVNYKCEMSLYSFLSWNVTKAFVSVYKVNFILVYPCMEYCFFIWFKKICIFLIQFHSFMFYIIPFVLVHSFPLSSFFFTWIVIDKTKRQEIDYLSVVFRVLVHSLLLIWFLACMYHQNMSASNLVMSINIKISIHTNC